MLTDGRKFIVFALPRTGSTTLVRLLNSHRDIRCLFEPFHPGRYSGRHYTIASMQSPALALELIWRNWNSIKHLWESNGWPFLANPQINDQIALASDCRFIMLMRRNLLRRVVSDSICRHTKFWIGTRAEFCERLKGVRLAALNPDAVSQQIQADKLAVQIRMQLFSDHKIPVMPLYYEDLFRENASSVERLGLINSVLSFLGFAEVTMPEFLSSWHCHFDPSVYQWASGEVYRSIPDIDRIEHLLGSDENGWLFR